MISLKPERILFEELPEEVRAVIAIAPSGVMFTRVRCDTWRIDFNSSHSTHSRWMSPWQHNPYEWAQAIAQIMRD